MILNTVYVETHQEIREHIQHCEGTHIQQVVYSTYHDALTQVCYGCKKIRTNLKEQEVKKWVWKIHLIV